MIAMLVTRPEPDAEETAARLRALDIEPVVAPLLERATLHTSLPKAEGFAALALTSANALRALEDRGVLRDYQKLRVFAVGDRTAAAAQAAGFRDVVSAGGTMRHLVEEIAGAGLSGPVFYPTARHQVGDLAAELAPYGVMVLTSRVYEMRVAAAMPADVLRRVQDGHVLAALFYSRRTAEAFVALTGDRLDVSMRRRLGMLCLSEQVAEPLVAGHFVRIGLADNPSEQGMMTLALAFAREQNTP